MSEESKKMAEIKPLDDKDLGSIMHFTNISKDTKCDCCKEAKADKDNLYAIKTNKNTLRSQDFVSYWDKGKRPPDDDCNNVCSYKGVSISIFTNETEEEVTKIYKSLFPLAPKYKPHLSVIKFYESSGLIKHTPLENNKHHYDFYKCDNFDYSKVELIKIEELH